RAARSPAPDRGAQARPTPRHRSCRSCTRAARSPLPVRIRDPNVPASELELVVHKPRTGHRLDRRHHPPAPLTLDLTHQAGKPVPIRRRRALTHTLTTSGERVPVKTLATEW